MVWRLGLVAIPTIVAPGHNEIDFLKAVLADITGPKIAGLTIEAKPVGIA